jgi:hypothetical protein
MPDPFGMFLLVVIAGGLVDFHQGALQFAWHEALGRFGAWLFLEARHTF